jgi:hypothetical protein
MKKYIIRRKYYYLLISPIILFYSCNLFTPTISTYDSYAYTQTTSIKVDAINLMGMATEDYQSHKTDIAAVQNNIQKIYEYEKHRTHDTITVRQWKLLTDTTGHLFGGFIIKWRKEKQLDKVYIQDKEKQVGFAFDQIAELESKKIQPSNIKN